MANSNKKNLASNGGFLDRVVFVPLTNHTEDLEWLASKADGISSYRVASTGKSLVDTVEDKSALIVWIDGDVVFLEDHTIPTMVKTKLDRPYSLVVSANVINQAALARLHSHPSIALSYLPELQPTQPADRDTWRASTLPRWKGPSGFQIRKGFPMLKEHRWLPSDNEAFDRTPIGTSIYPDDDPDWDEWTVKAQQHYSFLHHLELDDLRRYRFPIWKNPPESISTSCLCFMGYNVRSVEPYLMQEKQDAASSLSESEARSGKEITIDGKGVAAEYSSDHKSQGLDSTDVLRRYRSYAREMVC